ncbi:hypothetical protein HPP92_023293 [Vanilla planifolia]|uniref:RING-type E3 ubiquitin transferase n=1 Tax=Vanilla planifolia TaxID=51239 RepID=A0A835PQ32_VANPL|nr:hypothetical protein HPP92_023293 [Vanilla planifolia]
MVRRGLIFRRGNARAKIAFDLEISDYDHSTISLSSPKTSAEPGNSLVHPDHYLTRNCSDYGNRNVQPVPSLPVNTMNLAHQFRDYHERLMFYGNEYNTIQNYQAMQNIGLGSAVPSFHNSNMLSTVPGRNFPFGQSNVITEQFPLSINQTDDTINECSWHNQIFVSDPPCKRKIFDMIRGSYYNLNGSSSSSSYSSIPQWVQSYESLPQMVDPGFCHPEYEGRASLPGAEGPHWTGQSRSIAISNLQPELAFLPHQNCLLPGSYMMHTIHPANNAWASQFANVNNIGDLNSTWNQKNHEIYLQGRCLNSGPLEMGNTSMQAYTGSSCGLNSALLFHQPSMPNFHPPVQNLHVQSYRTQAHAPGSSQHAINGLRSISSNHSGDGLDAVAFYPHYPSAIGQINWSQQPPQPARQLSNGNLRLIPAEGVPLPSVSRFGVGHAIDQHHDMRLDIDEMSYEELLALEEQIGVVKTGLAEEFIIKNLKTRIYAFQQAVLASEHSSKLHVENEGCAICQVDYEKNEVIGALDCGNLVRKR